MSRNINDKLLYDVVSNEFNSMVNKPLFVVEPEEDLWYAYYNNLPESNRLEFNCNTCKKFIRKYGNICTINENNNIQSALWNIEAPEFFKDSISAMNRIIRKSKIKHIFISNISKTTLGVEEDTVMDAKNGHIYIFNHFNIDTSFRRGRNVSNSSDISSLITTSKNKYEMIYNVISKYDVSTLSKAYTLIISNTLYRGIQYRNQITWLLNIKKEYDKAISLVQKQNIIWKAIYDVSEDYCHINSSVLGALIKDISEIDDINMIISRFNNMMDPSRYRISTIDPTAKEVENAEKSILSLGLLESLDRRYATLDEIPVYLWKSSNNVSSGSKEDSNRFEKGIFSNVKVRDKGNKKEEIQFIIPNTVMTWEKFKKDILPIANSIEFNVNDSSRMMALVTASNKDSKNILKWNNPFSWYYENGIDGEIKQRVENAGGRYEDNVMRCSLIWDGFTDLDLHCITPLNRHIDFTNKRVDNGYLDIDMNGGMHRCANPVENIRWKTTPNIGTYHFIVNNYEHRSNSPVDYIVELEIHGKKYKYQGTSSYSKESLGIFKVDYRGENDFDVLATNTLTNSISNNWNINLGYNKVNLITTSPNTWDENTKELSGGEHIFFLLDNCKDIRKNVNGKGFFIEMLTSELREHSRTLESFISNSVISGEESANACGIGYNKYGVWNLELKVETELGARLITIDRME